MLISQPSLLEYQDFHKKIKEKDVIADPCLRRDMLVRVYPCTLYAGQSGRFAELWIPRLSRGMTYFLH